MLRCSAPNIHLLLVFSVWIFTAADSRRLHKKLHHRHQFLNSSELNSKAWTALLPSKRERQTAAWSATAFDAPDVPRSSASVFYKTFVGPTAEDLAKCYSRSTGRTIFDESGKVKGVHGYIPEDLGDYYLDQQVQHYAHVTSDMAKADVIVINSMPILSLVAQRCHGSNHEGRQKQIFEWIRKHQELLKRQPSVFSCPSWTCKFALDKTQFNMLASINATILINELMHEWLRTKGSLHWGIPIPYTAHHEIQRLPPRGLPNAPKKLPFLYVGSYRPRGPGAHVRGKLKLLKDEPGVFVHFSSLGLSKTAGMEKKILVGGYADYYQSAQFCFVPRGDTATSRRLFDAILSGCIPVIIADAIGINLPFSSTVPYNEFAIQVKESEWLNYPKAVLERLQSLDAAEIAQRRAAITRYAPYVDWLAGTNVLTLILKDVLEERQRQF